MNIIGGAKKMMGEVGKIIIIPKKEKPPELKNFIKESPEEYGQRLQKLRGRRY